MAVSNFDSNRHWHSFHMEHVPMICRLNHRPMFVHFQFDLKQQKPSNLTTAIATATVTTLTAQDITKKNCSNLRNKEKNEFVKLSIKFTHEK